MDWIKSIVSNLVKKHGTRNVYELIDILGITIIRKSNSSKKARFYRNIFNDEYIFLKDGLDEFEERFVLAHELGHAILHKDLPCEYFYHLRANTQKVEIQANYFATELLLDDKTFLNEIQDGKSAEQLSMMFGIPAHMLEYKLKEIS